MQVQPFALSDFNIIVYIVLMFVCFFFFVTTTYTDVK